MAYFWFLVLEKKRRRLYCIHAGFRGTQHCWTPFRGGAYSGLEAWGSGAGAGMGPWTGAGPEAVSEAVGGGRAGTWVDADAMFVRLPLPEVKGALHCSPLFSSLSFFLISFTSALSCLRSALRRCRSALRTVLSPRLGNLVWNVIRNTYLSTIKNTFWKRKIHTYTHTNQPFQVRSYWHISYFEYTWFVYFSPHHWKKKVQLDVFLCHRRFTSALLTFHAQGWTEVSWFSQGCGWGHGYVCTSHTGCRMGTHWKAKRS